jgi:hypothetical protein
MATNPPDPQFGVSLTPPQLNSELPFNVIYGVTPLDEYIPIQVNEAGQLSVGNVTITGPVTITGAIIQGVDPDNGNTPEDISVVNLGGGTAYALRTSLYDGANELTINSDGSIDTRITAGGNSLLVNPDGSIDVNITNPGTLNTNLNAYAENLAVPGGGATTTLFTYSVLASTTYLLNGFIGWGTYDAEFLVLKNSARIGGGWSSPTNRTLSIDYGATPIIANAGDVINITVTCYASSTQTFRLNVLAELMS